MRPTVNVLLTLFKEQKISRRMASEPMKSVHPFNHNRSLNICAICGEGGEHRRTFIFNF